jgi:GGDEF domain-containing protein
MITTTCKLSSATRSTHGPTSPPPTALASGTELRMTSVAGFGLLPARASLLRVVVPELERVRVIYGRLAGNGALRAVTASAAHEAGLHDVVRRIGDELLVVVVDGNLREAWALGVRICRRVRRLALSAGSQRVELAAWVGAASTSEIPPHSDGDVAAELWRVAGKRLTATPDACAR